MVQTGLSLADGTLASTPVADWERKVKITLMTAVNMTRAAIPQMQAQKHGRIIVRVCVGVWVAFCLSS
jgi:NADP-dependent 3-hydroxy acid dehydrogenase YdfG